MTCGKKGGKDRVKNKKGLNSPLVWYGGKGAIKNWILEHLASYPHKIYVEPFGGGASVLLCKEPASVEVYNDLNGGLAEFFHVLADARKFNRFYRTVRALPHSRKVFYDYRKEHLHEKDLVRRVAKWFLVARQSFAGNFGQGWGYSIRHSSRGMSQSVSSWLSALDRLPEIHARLQRVQIESLPALEIVRKYDTPDTLFYLDPPYVLDTRVGGEVYRHEMTDGDHGELVETLLSIKGSACLSGYEHWIYRPLVKSGWTIRRREYPCTANRVEMGQKRSKRMECLYMSPKKR